MRFNTRIEIIQPRLGTTVRLTLTEDTSNPFRTDVPEAFMVVEYWDSICSESAVHHYQETYNDFAVAHKAFLERAHDLMRRIEIRK